MPHGKQRPTLTALIKAVQDLLRSGNPVQALTVIGQIHRRGHETAATCLLGAQAAQALGQKSLAVALLDNMDDLSPADHERHLAAQILHQEGDHRAALNQLEQTEGPKDWLMHFDLNHALHRQAEASECLDRAVAAHPEDPMLARRSVQFRIAARDLAGAFTRIHQAIQFTPADPHLLCMRAVLCSRIQPEAADPFIQAAWEVDPAWPLLDCWARIGRHDRMDTALAERLKQHPGDPPTLAAMGRMALWRGDTIQAQRWAQEALALAPGLREGAFILGAIAVLEGRPEDAVELLTQSIEGSDPVSWLHIDAAWTFKACALRDLGDYTTAMKTAAKAMETAQDYNVAAHIARLTSAFHVFTRSTRMDPRHMEIASQVRDLADDPQAQWDGRTNTFAAGMEAVQRRLSGNRSSLTSYVDENGDLQQHIVPPYPRNLGRKLQQQLRCRSPQDVIVDFDALQQAHPGDPTVLTYRGELQVWLGDYTTAAADFRTAIKLDPRTTWAWIGLAATHLYLDRLSQALETLAEGIIQVQYEGPTVFVYRGEALRLMGDLEAAHEDLKTATTHKPQRLSAWINRALCAQASGNDEPARILGDRLRETNPSLWWDAAEACDEEREILSRCLTLMRGNRSSTLLTYHTTSGVIRMAQWSPEDVPAALRAALGDASQEPLKLP